MIRFRLAELIADKTFKEKRAVTLGEVAKDTGVHRTTLSRMANHPGANISTDVVEKLCRYFGCQPGDLMILVDDDSDALS